MVEYSTCVRNTIGFKYNFSSTGRWTINERTIKILEDLLRACILKFGGKWKDQLSLVEFIYNNNYQATTGMAPYEALYGRRCRMLVCWEEVVDKKLYEGKLIEITSEKVRIIKDRTKSAQDR
jgi:hypothetical protein